MKPKFIIGIAGVGLLALMSVIVLVVPTSPVANATECNDKGVFYRVGLDVTHLDNLGISASDPIRGGFQITNESSLIGKEIDTINVWLFKNADPDEAMYEGTTFDVYIRDSNDSIVTVVAEDQDITTLASSELFGPDYTTHRTNYEFAPHIIQAGDRISFEYADGDGTHYLGIVADTDAAVTGITPQVFSDGTWVNDPGFTENVDLAAIIGNMG